MANNFRKSFTLIELLVVLALVAILSVVVVITLNPAELIKQARDSNRLSDLSTINTALNLFSADVASGFMGTSTVVYVSIPSASPTCSGLGLPTLPSTYTYNCVTSAVLRNTNGTGWIPVNFQRISSNSPISQLPIDPINTTSTRLYYTYITGGSWELNASIEATKNKLGGSGDLVSRDGGSAPSQYEAGNNLNLSPIESGDSSLVGYWNFEEGPNTTSTDRSGYGNHGTWYGTSTQGEHYVAGRVGNYAGYFNGTNDSIGVLNAPLLTTQGTLSAVVNASGWGAQYDSIIFKSSSLGWSGINYVLFRNGGNPYFIGSINNGTNNLGGSGPQSTSVSLGEWNYLVFTWDGGVARFYVNGTQTSQVNWTYAAGNTSNNMAIGRSDEGSTYAFFGKIDDIRIYDRALSAAEVLSLYNATK